MEDIILVSVFSKKEQSEKKKSGHGKVNMVKPLYKTKITFYFRSRIKWEKYLYYMQTSKVLFFEQKKCIIHTSVKYDQDDIVQKC